MTKFLAGFVAGIVLAWSGIASAGAAGDGFPYTERAAIFCGNSAEIRGIEMTPRGILWVHRTEVDLTKQVTQNGSTVWKWNPGTAGQPGSVTRGFAEFVGKGQVRTVVIARNGEGIMPKSVTNQGTLPYTLLILCIVPLEP